MAIAVRGTPVVTSGNPTTSGTITIPSDVEVNDVMIVCAVNGGATAAGSCADNSGVGSWTQVATQAGSGNTTAGTVWWKRVTNTGSERGATITVSGMTDSMCGGLVVYSGAETSGSPLDGTPATEANAAADVTHAGYTVVNAGAEVIWVGAFDDNLPLLSNATNVSTANMGNLTVRIATSSTGGADSQVYLRSATKATTGATGTITWGDISDPGASIVFALKPLPPQTLTGAVALAGSGAMAAVGSLLWQGASALAGSGALAAAGTRIRSGAVAIAGSGALAADGTVVPAGGGWGAPQNLEATAVSSSQIDLTWDAVTGATGYDIERDGTVIVYDHATTTYSDTGRAASTQYTYRVRAVGA